MSDLSQCAETVLKWRMRCKGQIKVLRHCTTGFALELVENSNGWIRIFTDKSYIVWSNGRIEDQEWTYEGLELLESLKKSPQSDLARKEKIFFADWTIDAAGDGICISHTGLMCCVLKSTDDVFSDLVWGGSETSTGATVNKLFREFADTLPKLILTVETPLKVGDGFRVACITIGGSDVASVAVTPTQSLGALRRDIAQKVNCLTCSMHLLDSQGSILMLDDELTTLGDLLRFPENKKQVPSWEVKPSKTTRSLLWVGICGLCVAGSTLILISFRKRLVCRLKGL